MARIWQYFHRSCEQIRGRAAIPESRAERQSSSWIFVQSFETWVAFAPQAYHTALCLFHETYDGFRFNSNDVRHVSLRKGLDSNETFSLVCCFQQRGAPRAGISRGSLLLFQSRIWTCNQCTARMHAVARHDESLLVTLIFLSLKRDSPALSCIAQRFSYCYVIFLSSFNFYYLDVNARL